MGFISQFLSEKVRLVSYCGASKLNREQSDRRETASLSDGLAEATVRAVTARGCREHGCREPRMGCIWGGEGVGEHRQRLFLPSAPWACRGGDASGALLTLCSSCGPQGYLCLPYMALQQHHLLSDVTVRGFVAGATNILFRQQKHLSDAIVEVGVCPSVLGTAGPWGPF